MTGISIVDAPKGTVLSRRGDTCSGILVVVVGLIKLSLQRHADDEKVVALLGGGESFGEPEMFLERPCRFRAASLVDSKLIHLSRETVLSEFERAPPFARGIVASLSARLHQYMDDFEGHTLRTGTERVIAYLLKLLPVNSSADISTITFPAPKRIIASHLNLTHEYFSRILHELTAEGLIEVRGRAVRILDSQQLRGYAD